MVYEGPKDLTQGQGRITMPAQTSSGAVFRGTNCQHEGQGKRRGKSDKKQKGKPSYHARFPSLALSDTQGVQYTGRLKRKLPDP